MKLAALPIGVAALLSVGGTKVQAQYMEWISTCLTGSLQACASTSLQMQYDATLDRTTFRITLSNPQGFDPGVQHPEVQYGIRGVTFDNLIDSGVVPRDQTTTMASTVEGNADGCCFENYIQVRRDTLADGRFLSNVGVGTFLGAVFVWGCDGNAPEAWHVPSYHTCGGSLVLSFTLRGHLELTESTTMRFTGGTETGERIECRFGENCTVVTPEPGVLILLATGLIVVLSLAIRGRLL